MNHDNRASGGNDRASNRLAHRAFFRRWRALWLCLGLCWADGVALANFTYSTSDATVRCTVRRRAQIKVASFYPHVTKIEAFNGTTWDVFTVGQFSSNATMTWNGTQFICFTQSPNVPNSGPVGTTFEVAVPIGVRDVPFKLTMAGTGQVMDWYAAFEAAAQTWDVTKGPLAGFNTYTEEPPSYVDWAQSTEGGGAPFVDNGDMPDLDNDGVPDNEDPDDDGDGRPDGEDAFPRDPNEKDDTDGDGQGNNVDPDDDNDGRPDVDDDHPTDPDRQDQDTDEDGVPDDIDKFPGNPQEWNDQDDDGVGDNIDPDDNSPPGGGNVGDGDGGPGTGDGGGQPGPIPGPGDDGTDTGTTGPGDTSGEIKPSATMKEMAGVGTSIAPIIGDRLGNFNPIGVSAIGKTSVISHMWNVGPLGSHEVRIDFNENPWPPIRMALLVAIIFLVGRSAIETLKV